jgi:hypothetical protein
MLQRQNLRAALVGVTAILFACSDASQTTTQPGTAASVLSRVSAAKRKTLTERNDVQIVSATGDIASAVQEYRDLLGVLSPNAVGEQAGDRREVNWDAAIVPTNTDAFPGNFFNVNSPRGVLFTTDGSGFRVSDNGYVDVNPNYAGEFNAFSPKKLFVARGSTIIDIDFVVAGTNQPASVTGFGSVFSDVGDANSTIIEFFGADDRRLLKIAAPRRSDERGLSFVGAKFDSRIVAHVRITAGDTPIGADVNDNVKGAGQKRDIVATDDFIYGEPRLRN